MKKIVLLLATFLSLFSKELTIASYNLDNLFDDVDNGTEYSDYKLGLHNWNKAIVNKKIKNISRVICDLDADVVGLQEVENKNALSMLLKYLNRVGCNYRYSAITNKKGSSIQVALISKIKIKKSSSIRVSQSSGDRDILKVTLDTSGALTIFVNHWRSKRAKESQRVKYAKALIKAIEKMPKDAEYIILGDFNSEYNECSLIDKINHDTKGVCGIDTILKTYYKNSLIKLNEHPNISLYHYNLWSQIEPHYRYSYDFFGRKSAIDSIIIPKSLNDNRGWRYIKRSFKVFKKRYLFKKSYINRWEIKNSKHTGYGYSDHLPIYAKFSNGIKESKHESMLDKIFKNFIPHKADKKESKKSLKNRIEVAKNELTLEELAAIKSTTRESIVKRACVIFKRGDIAVVKNSKNAKPIMLYRCAEPLKEGRCYQLSVYKKKRYYKIDEITDLKPLKELGSIDSEALIAKFDIKKFKEYYIGDIVKDIRGIYKSGYLHIADTKVKLYVKKKRRGLLKKGSHLYIKKAQIGYYKGEKELVVYSLDDITKEN
jgi:hypothetical protein